MQLVPAHKSDISLPTSGQIKLRPRRELFFGNFPVEKSSSLFDAASLNVHFYSFDFCKCKRLFDYRMLLRSCLLCNRLSQCPTGITILLLICESFDNCKLTKSCLLGTVLIRSLTFWELFRSIVKLFGNYFAQDLNFLGTIPLRILTFWELFRSVV